MKSAAVWKMLVDTVFAFFRDEALSRGGAIAFYAVTSLAPILLRLRTSFLGGGCTRCDK
jgi:uncharacterized BrkB/YihY/UPF0761 family membrane protein